MRCTLLALLTATLASVSFAQSSSTSYLTDINGRRVEGVSNTTAVVGIKDVEKTELLRSINGREVPLEQVEQKVLREDSSGRTVEKIRRRFDGTGRLSSTEREVTEEQRRSDGSGTSRSVVYRNDVNGNSVEAERRVTETRVQGSTT